MREPCVKLVDGAVIVAAYLERRGAPIFAILEGNAYEAVGAEIDEDALSFLVIGKLPVLSLYPVGAGAVCGLQLAGELIAACLCARSRLKITKAITR